MTDNQLNDDQVKRIADALEDIANNLKFLNGHAHDISQALQRDPNPLGRM